MKHSPIRVSTLRGDQKIEFDAYLKINEKFILYLRKGDSFEGVRLERLKEKKLKQMYISQDDELQYRKYLTQNIDLGYDKNSTASLAVRAEIVQGHQQSNVEELMENPSSEGSYQAAKDSAARFVDFLNQENPGAMENILNISNLDLNIAHHGVTVSSLSIMLGKRLGVTDSKQSQLLSLGALLHDFGHFENPMALNRPLSEFSPAELTEYKKHPTDGAQKLLDKKHFDQTVLSIIAQHEEYIDGKGFPNGLTESKMDPLAIIVATTNALDRLITFEAVPRKDAAKKLIMNAVGRYPLKHLQLLGDILNQTKS